jgi:flagellar hook-associated protein 3 FlgL
MNTTFISTSAISQATQLSLLKMQSSLAEVQTEATTGRLADVGLSLGYQTGQTVSLRNELSRLTAITDTNNQASTRLDASQTALQTIASNAQSFLNQLLASPGTASGASALQNQAQSALNSLIDGLNTTVNGAYIFSGANSDVQSINQYSQTPPSASQQAVAAAFTSAFGTTQSDPTNSNITSAAMGTFLNTTFANLFSDPAWGNTWSSASDQNARSRISTSQLIDTSTNANQQAFRQLASAYTMVADLGAQNLNSNAFQTIVNQAAQLAGNAIQGITTIESTLGAAQASITNANDGMAIQTNFLTTQINNLEAVDPAEASTRLSALMTQIDTSYSITSRIQQLSLLNYLPTG